MNADGIQHLDFGAGEIGKVEIHLITGFTITFERVTGEAWLKIHEELQRHAKYLYLGTNVIATQWVAWVNYKTLTE